MTTEKQIQVEAESPSVESYPPPVAERHCNRKACQQLGARWWNKSTRAYYCDNCARAINEHSPDLCVKYRTQDDCADCKDAVEPCAYHARMIHESWHEAGLFWIRREECHENCPGLKK